MKKIISLKEKDYKLRNRMKLNKKKVDDLFEILDSLLLKEFPKSKLRGYDFMLMDKQKNQSVTRYSFKNCCTRDYLFLYYNTEDYLIEIPETDLPFHRGSFLNNKNKKETA